MTIKPPSSHNGSYGFTDCNLMSGFYHCNSHQIFNCSADPNQYYVWIDTLGQIIMTHFTNPLQQVKVLMTYFIPGSSGEVRISFPQTNGVTSLSDTQLITLPANGQQLNVTLVQAISAVNTILVTLIFTSSIAINRITFCSEPEG